MTAFTLRMLSPAFSRPSPALATGNGPVGRAAAGATSGSDGRCGRAHCAQAGNRYALLTASLRQPAGGGTRLAWRDYATLYAIPVVGGGHRSLFGSDGLVAGSERAERWLLWPMGVPSPGAMRERGRHAGIAFVGRRHFDDADLLDRLFEPAEEER